MTHITIIGGGISGLATAWYLQQHTSHPLSYTLLEQSERWGGKILTETVADFTSVPFVVEGGPDSFLTQKPWAAQLARELGIEADLLPSNDARRKTFVLNKGKPTNLPDGVMLIVPTKIKPFLLSNLISPVGKLRMGLDWVIPPKKDDADETLADFIRRRLGDEALDKMAEPLLSGIYNADAERQSLMATFPRFREIERKHGSLIKGMLAAASHHTSPSPNGNSTGAKTTLFTSFTGGMGAFITTLSQQLTGDCRLGVAVTHLAQQQSGTAPRYEVTLSDGTTLLTDAVVLAVPAFAAAHLLQHIAPTAAQELAQIRYVSTGTISLAYRRDTINHPLHGFGIVIPRSEKRPINAITWSSTKFEQRAPEGYALLRVFFGGSRTPEMMDVNDTTLLATVKKELETIMGIRATPLFHRIYRWERSNPQYDVGHLERVARVRAALPKEIWLTGSPYEGVGIPDCIHQAQQTALQLQKRYAAA